VKSFNKARLQTSDLLQKLAEKEQTVAHLEQENKVLSKEKFNLLSRLESTRDFPDSSVDGPCLKVQVVWFSIS
jgi:hypothetical protein